MRELFNCEVGLSDHTLGIGVAAAAVAMGARVIEKHFTLSRADGGVDSAFSLEPDELRLLVQETKRAFQALGAVKYGPTKSEEKTRSRRRSLFIAEDMCAGDELTEKNLRRVCKYLFSIPILLCADILLLTLHSLFGGQGK